MDLSTGPLVFAEGTAGAPFLVALCIGTMVALVVPLLRRWPPTPLRWGLAAAVLALGIVGLAAVLIDREVAVDPSAREVRESQRLLGVGRQERWPFSAFDAVRVDYRPQGTQRRSMQPARPSDPEVRDRFVVELVGSEARVRLHAFDDALRAEDFARGIARVGDWSARRRGYEVLSGTGRAGDALAVGQAQAFEAPDGRQGVGITLDRWVRVKIREGVESPLDEER